jgi:hypothetical protein
MPDITYSIRVVDEDGDGIGSEKVTVLYDWTNDSDWTDDEGWVTFEKSNLVRPGASVKVYVRGELLDEIWVEDGDTFSLTCTG